MSTPTQQPFFASNKPQSTHYSHSSYLPVIFVVAVITILSVASCILGCICSRGRINGHVSNDLEKGSDIAKADATKSKNKEAMSSKINPKMTTATLNCEVHGKKNNLKKIVATKTTATATVSAMSKKQGLNRCELHGVCLSRNNNTSDLSGANEERLGVPCF